MRRCKLTRQSFSEWMNDDDPDPRDAGVRTVVILMIATIIVLCTAAGFIGDVIARANGVPIP